MATTANYGWTTPDDTDLVKDGASAIRSLGTAIDTTVKSVSDASGLVHINTTALSAVASQSFDNVFTGTYRNYKISIGITSVSTSAALTLRLRASSTDETAANYRWASSFKSNWTGSISADGNTGQTAFTINASGYGKVAGSWDIFAPALATETIINGTKTEDRGGLAWGGYHTLTTAYDGFSLITASGTITGSISIYGYKD